MNGLTEVTS